jgi:hypothetical protein
VRDEDQGGLALDDQLAQQLEDLRRDRHVECRGRLVGDEQARLAGQRHRDHHALPHAAGQLVRKGPEAAGRRPRCRR